MLLIAADTYHPFGVVYQAGHIVPAPEAKDHPVAGITWYGALLLCNGLSLLEGLSPAYSIANRDGIQNCSWDANGYRLPTEAEWEYGARGGNQRVVFPWGDKIDDSVANFLGSKNPFNNYPNTNWKERGPTTPVGFFNGDKRGTFHTRSNNSPFGLFDMGGNVSEWCWDTYNPNYYSFSPDIDPRGPNKGPGNIALQTMVTRGGSWGSWPEALRVFARDKIAPFSWSDMVGVRVARSPRP